MTAVMVTEIPSVSAHHGQGYLIAKGDQKRVCSASRVGDRSSIGNGGIHIVDISNPASPLLVTTRNARGFARRICIAGAYAYVAVSDSGMQIVNISNPANPTLAGKYIVRQIGL